MFLRYCLHDKWQYEKDGTTCSLHVESALPALANFNDLRRAQFVRQLVRRPLLEQLVAVVGGLWPTLGV